ncbi:hypothetical protein I552_7988 [Mycobacterium xenopi 3993]|nr:hypothetical protein I552_7988 [Mycobacterium xenopi 3993]
MTTPRGKINPMRTPPYKTAGVVALALGVLITALVYWQFRGNFTQRHH